MRIIVCGGRDFNDEAFVFAALDHFHKKHPIKLLIEGGQTGSDTLASNWAKSRGILGATFYVCDAAWKNIGGKAGPIRNGLMLCMEPDALIAFPGGKGTKNMVEQAESKSVRIWQPRYT